MNAAALQSAVVRGRSFLERQFMDPARPQVAIEVRAGSVGVVRLVAEGKAAALGAAALVELPPGQRPLRTAVGLGSAGVRRFNELTGAFQLKMMEAFGLAGATGEEVPHGE